MESLIVNCETGDEVRQTLTSEEIKDFEALAQRQKEELESQVARQSAIMAKFKMLGFTEDDLKVLGLGGN